MINYFRDGRFISYQRSSWCTVLTYKPKKGYLKPWFGHYRDDSFFIAVSSYVMLLYESIFFFAKLLSVGRTNLIIILGRENRNEFNSVQVFSKLVGFVFGIYVPCQTKWQFCFSLFEWPFMNVLNLFTVNKDVIQLCNRCCTVCRSITRLGLVSSDCMLRIGSH